MFWKFFESHVININDGEITMSLEETIMKDLQSLPPSEQAEVLNFVEYLKIKAFNKEGGKWTNLSLSSAMRGMEDEETPYSLDDLKESF
jgi:hypothetical protein